MLGLLRPPGVLLVGLRHDRRTGCVHSEPGGIARAAGEGRRADRAKPARGAEPAVADRPADRHRLPRAQQGHAPRGTRPRHRHVASGRHQRPGTPLSRVPPRNQRRHGTARSDRHRIEFASPLAGGRRTDQRIGRHHPGRLPGPHVAHDPRRRFRGVTGHAGPWGDRELLRPSSGHAGRRGGRGSPVAAFFAADNIPTAAPSC